jgi:hypothetical protein
VKQIKHVVAVVTTSVALAACAGDAMLDDELLAPGDVVEREGLAAIAPEPGESMQVTATMVDGSSRVMTVETLEDGSVNVIEPSVFLADEVADDQAVELLAGGPPRACQDDFWVGFVFRQQGTYRWHFNAGTTPRALSENNVEDTLVRATRNITKSRNDCGMNDRVGATQDYRGRTDRRADISASTGCTAQDGVNVTDFGDLPAAVLGLTCTRFSGTQALESDMRLNKDDHRWYVNKPADCRNRFSIEAVTTHERGHTFGLADLSVENHGNLTMAGGIGACKDKASTLGRGDVLGLRNKY